MKQSVYAVRVGRSPGLYHTWADCQAQVNGFSGARFKKFSTEAEARTFLDGDEAQDVAAGNAIVGSDAPPMAPVEPGRCDSHHTGEREHDCDRAGARRRQNAKPRLQRKQPRPRDVIFSELHLEQAAIAEAVLAGHNVFFTGLPGSGKSHLLQRIVELLQGVYGDDRYAVAVCAATGAAAVHVGGSTVHAFIGCGLGQREEDWENVTKARKRLQMVQVLLIDEISMISSSFLDRVSDALSEVRMDAEPFGGLQVVLCGDFLQLPPVKEDSMAFEASAWARLRLRSYVLQQNHRQADDLEFQVLLREVRLGSIPEAIQEVFHDPVLEAPGVEAKLMPRLVCTNAEAEAENLWRLKELPGEEFVFKATDWAKNPSSPSVRKAFQDLIVEPKIKLKKGALVMLLKNLRLPSQCKEWQQRGRRSNCKDLDLSSDVFENARLQRDNASKLPERYRGLQTPLINGSIGIVVDFDDGCPLVEFEHNYRRCIRPKKFSGDLGDEGEYCRTQVPLKLAWSLTVHKTQGMTLARGVVDLSRALDHAQIYVALSRFKSLTDATIEALPSSSRCLSSEMRMRAMAFHADLESACQGLCETPMESVAI